MSAERRSHARRGSIPLRLPLVVGGLAVAFVLAAAWLFVPRAGTEAADLAPAVRVCVVDASASVCRARPGWLPWVRGVLRDEAEAARARGQDLAVVSFASEVGLSFPPGPPAAFLRRLEGSDGSAPFDPRAGAGDDGASRLAGALEVAAHAALAPGRAPGAVILLGTESTTGEDPAPALVRLRRAGVLLARRRPSAPLLSDLSLRRLVLPRRVEAGSPLTAIAHLALAPGSTPVEAVWLDVEIENAGFVTNATLSLRPPALGGTWEVALDCGPAGFGRTEVRATARLRPGPDPIPENDAARASSVAEGELVVGVVAEADRLDAARAWLAASGSSGLAGIQFVFAERRRLPELVDQLDALVTFDVPPTRLPEILVESFLAEGGGWLATGGWRFLEAWTPGTTDAGLAGLLPLEPAPLDQGPRDVVLLVDGSGSMEGEPFETVRAAAMDLVGAALPADEVTLRFFTGRLEAPHLVKPRARRGAREPGVLEEAARQLLRLRVPRGETSILHSLEEFAAERARAPHETLALLMTDGLEREAMPDRAARAAALLDLLASARTRMRVLAIGARADLAFLELVTPEGEEVLRPTGLDDLRAIFRREISGARWREADEIPVRWSSAPAGSIAAEVGGTTPPPLPSLRRLARGALRGGAEVLWIADGGEPVLALQRVRAGRTALFASLPAAGWAPAWTGRAGLGEPGAFAGLVRWLGRGTRRRPGGVRAAWEPGRIVLTGLDASWPGSVAAQILDAREPGGLELAHLSLRPGAGGVAGEPLARREAPIAHDLARRMRTAEAVLRVVAPSGRLLLPLEAPLPSEFGGGGRALRAEDLEPLAAARGGFRLPLATRAHAAAPWLLGAGLALLFASALIRPTGQGIRPRGR